MSEPKIGISLHVHVFGRGFFLWCGGCVQLVDCLASRTNFKVEQIRVLFFSRLHVCTMHHALRSREQNKSSLGAWLGRLLPSLPLPLPTASVRALEALLVPHRPRPPPKNTRIHPWRAWSTQLNSHSPQQHLPLALLISCSVETTTVAPSHEGTP